MQARDILCMKHFNSHPHEEDDGDEYSNYVPVIISTHILTKRMTAVFARCWSATLYFNSHPHEEDDVLHCVIGDIKNHFNSHPHEEDDRLKRTCKEKRYISTHILTKRMTKGYAQKIEYLAISTHILTKRMTVRKNESIQRVQYFNSHPHEEDDVRQRQEVVSLAISTHILTKRMTVANTTVDQIVVISTHILTKRMTDWK